MAAALFVAPAAEAQTGQTQIVSGVGINTLSLGAPVGGGVLADLKPGATATSLAPAAFAVVSPAGQWNLKVRDDGGNGRLDAAAEGCTGSASELANQLTYSGDPQIGSSSTVNGTLSGSDTLVASDTSLADTVLINYSQVVGATEQIKALCAYTVTATYTLAAGLP